MVCAYCGEESNRMHLDHVVPRSRGGPDTPHNLVSACGPCNLSKSDRLPSEWLDVVPDAVADIEARVSAVVAVGVRTRRGRRPASVSSEVHCDPCFAVIAARLDGSSWGTLRLWLSEPRDGSRRRVDAVRVICPSCWLDGVACCMDVPLERLAGDAAVVAAARLMGSLDFGADDAEFVAGVVSALQHMRPGAAYRDMAPEQADGSA